LFGGIVATIQALVERKQPALRLPTLLRQGTGEPAHKGAVANLKKFSFLKILLAHAHDFPLYWP
jgi:hypothetical protein